MTHEHARSPLKLAVLGLDSRAENLFRMFFQGPCQNNATVVSAAQAEATLIDLDVPQGKALFQQFRETNPTQIIVLLSISEPQVIEPNIVFVKKPAQAQTMMKAIEDARRLSREVPTKTLVVEGSDNSPNGNLKVVQGKIDGQATPKRAASLLDEQTFKSYLGYRDDVDPNDHKKVASMIYVPRDYLQGHIQSAWELACNREQPLRLETPWRSVSFFPQQQLVHVDADEPQVRAACSIPFRNIASVDIGLGEKKALSNICTITSDEADELLRSKQMNSIAGFLWKIALLTSKGRLPESIHPFEPLGLKYWPNMTRLLLPPHAMRIASLLINKSVTPFEAASVLNIRQQYVFAFLSAAHVLDLIEQRNQPRPELPPSHQVAPERVSILRKILHRLKVI